MNTEERLKKAEELLQSIIDSANNNAPECYGMVAAGHIDRAKKFLNPEPVIDWKAVPIGTEVLHGKDKHKVTGFGDIKHDSVWIGMSTVYCHSLTIPPQESHIHKCQWPSDGKRPDWVNDDDLVILYWANSYGITQPYRADDVGWEKSDDIGWFAVLKIAEYRK